MGSHLLAHKWTANYDDEITERGETFQLAEEKIVD